MAEHGLLGILYKKPAAHAAGVLFIKFAVII